MSRPHGGNCCYSPMGCQEEVTLRQPLFSAIKYANVRDFKIVKRALIARAFLISRALVISPLCARRLRYAVSTFLLQSS